MFKEDREIQFSHFFIHLTLVIVKQQYKTKPLQIMIFTIGSCQIDFVAMHSIS